MTPVYDVIARWTDKSGRPRRAHYVLHCPSKVDARREAGLSLTLDEGRVRNRRLEVVRCPSTARVR